MGAGLEIKKFMHEPGPLAQFIELPYRLYRGDMLYVPPFRDAEAALFSENHPFLTNGLGKEQRFLACRDGKPVARAAAIVNRRLAEGSPPVGFFGFFEAENDPEAVKALLDEVCHCLAAWECTVARGPLDRDTWHRYRIMTKGFREHPILREPYNPDYYARLLEHAGFSVCGDYVSTINMKLAPVLELHRKFLVYSQRQGYTFRTIDLARLDAELKLLYELSLEGFDDNYCYSPIDEADFMELYRPMAPLLDPNLVIFGLAPGGKESGFAFAYPELSRALQAMGGSRGFFAKLKFWLATRERSKVMNYKTLAVTADARNKGLASGLTAKLYENAIAGGYEVSRHCLMKKENVSRRFDAGAGVTFKEYALYERRGGK